MSDSFILNATVLHVNFFKHRTRGPKTFFRLVHGRKQKILKKTTMTKEALNVSNHNATVQTKTKQYKALVSHLLLLRRRLTRRRVDGAGKHRVDGLHREQQAQHNGGRDGEAKGHAV